MSLLNWTPDRAIPADVLTVGPLNIEKNGNKNVWELVVVDGMLSQIVVPKTKKNVSKKCISLSDFRVRYKKSWAKETLVRRPITCPWFSICFQ